MATAADARNHAVSASERSMEAAAREISGRPASGAYIQKLLRNHGSRVLDQKKQSISEDSISNSETRTLTTNVPHNRLHYAVTRWWLFGRRAKFSSPECNTALQHEPKPGPAHTSRPHQLPGSSSLTFYLSRLQVLLRHLRPWSQWFLSQQVRPMMPQSTVLVTENVAALLFLSKFLPLAVFEILRGLNFAAHENTAGSQLCLKCVNIGGIW